ncbi:phosphatase PAP2 family protein [Actinocorallia longicatena]|uniref:Phosphatidic acid phosphatase type 2/haloperoxidase domain-containing protein n=1 Tax=Actinocorallia longicatena TaxID=111803 RepID=A0ABP6QCR2_9ACTN
MQGLAQLLTLVGSAVVYAPLLLVVYWCVSPVLGARLAVLLTLSGALNELVKLLLHQPRPYWTDTSLATSEPIASFGMPSGHAQNSVIVWGTLARAAGRRAAWAAAVALMLGIGWARTELHVHSPAQVLAGWGAGLMLLAGCWALEEPVTGWWRERPLGVQLGLSLLLPLLLLAGIRGAAGSLQDWTMPAQWAEAVRLAGGRTPRFTAEPGASVTGLLAGILAGLSVLAARGGFTVAGSAWQRVARVPIGLLGFLVVSGAGYFLGEGIVMKFVLFALAGAWATGGAPEAFIRMGLAYRGSRNPERQPV